MITKIQKLLPSFKLSSDLVFLLAVLIASLALNVGFARRLGQSAQAVQIAEAPLPVGRLLPPLVAKRLGGGVETREMSGRARGTILYAFTTVCGWCYKNTKNANHLAATTAGAYDFIGIALNDSQLKEYVAQHGFAFPVYSNPNKATKLAYKLGPVPYTVAISSDGRVTGSWTGAYNGETKGHIERTFRVTLPGLIQLPPPGPTECVDSEGLSYSEGAIEKRNGTFEQCSRGKWRPLT